MRVVVGTIVRPHGIRGEVVVDPRTDQPVERFGPGRALLGSHGTPLHVATSRPHAGRLLVRFDGIVDRNGAEGLRGVVLEAESDPPSQLDDPDVYPDGMLVGLSARTRSGEPLGTVVAVEHLPMQDLLVLAHPDGFDVQVPFVSAIVTEVHVDDGWLEVDPPAGLVADHGVAEGRG